MHVWKILKQSCCRIGWPSSEWLDGYQALLLDDLLAEFGNIETKSFSNLRITCQSVHETCLCLQSLLIFTRLCLLYWWLTDIQGIFLYGLQSFWLAFGCRLGPNRDGLTAPQHSCKICTQTSVYPKNACFLRSGLKLFHHAAGALNDLHLGKLPHPRHCSNKTTTFCYKGEEDTYEKTKREKGTLS